MDELKRCSKCKEEKVATLEFFGACNRVRSGLKAECRKCKRISELAAYHSKPEIRQKQSEQAQARAAKLIATERACTRCGQVKPKTMEFFAADATQPQGLHCWCRHCQVAAAKARSAANPERRQEILAGVLLRHGERYKAERRAKYALDPEYKARKLARDKIHYLKIKGTEHVRRIAREGRRRRMLDPTCRDRARGHSRRTYQRHREKYIAIAANDRAKRKAVDGKITRETLEAAFKGQGGKCFYCGHKVGTRGGRTKWHADHFIPISRGGTNHPENIVIACEPCNLSKHNKMPWEWMPDKFSAPVHQSL